MKRAYRDLAKVWHPDRFVDNPRLQKKATERLVEINIAYQELLVYFGQKDGAEKNFKHIVSNGSPSEDIHAHGTCPSADAPPIVHKRHGFGAWPVVLVGVAVVIAVAVLSYIDMKRKTEDRIVPLSIPISGKPGNSQVIENSVPQKKASAIIKLQGEKAYKFRKYDRSIQKDFFTLGSSKDEVLAVQGTPTQMSDNRWSYGFSYVDFEKGKVVNWYNSNLDPLRLRMLPKKDPDEQKDFFTLGSSKDEVLAVQGTPTQMSDNRWSYGFSYVDFEKGKVARWYSSDENPLRVNGE